jgi:glutathione reductase (NADPH)
MDLEQLPERIVMVGGRYIAAEFSHIAARACAQVTVLQCSERILKRFDVDLVAWLMNRFREIGIDVRVNHPVNAIEKSAPEYRVRTQIPGGYRRPRGACREARPGH